MIPIDDELAQDYLAECAENLSTMETVLLSLEAGGPDIDEELIHRVFRAAHSVKGGAGFFGLVKIRELAHLTEDALALIRAHKMEPTPDRIKILLDATDRMGALIQDPGASNDADIDAISAALTHLSAGVRGPAPRAAPDVQTRILLVEDDFASRLVLQTFLSRYGECHIAVTGVEAVAAFRASLDGGEPYALICMDIMMPEMDGREAVREIRALEESRGILSTRGVKIVMTTALDRVKDVTRCFMELCDDYLLKPIDLAKLLNLLKAYGLTP